MKFCHISDTHSTFPEIDNSAEFIIHSGNFFPNFSSWFKRQYIEELDNQHNWLIDNIEHLKKQLDGRDFIFILGNHDYLNPEFMQNVLVENGINAINLTNKSVEYKGRNFYGFPYIPFIDGTWCYELHNAIMHSEFEKVINTLNKKYHDVLVCHSAPANILDECRGINLGSNTITNGLFYKIAKEMQPEFVLFGHIHEGNGILKIDDMTFSNAATIQNYLEFESK